jgi:hypothetical protein
MKIVFLDVDGVLNYENFYALKMAGRKTRIYVPEEYPQSEFCPLAIANLNKIVEKTNAKVVMSSTWRLGRSIETLQNLLESVGFNGEVIDKTPDLGDSALQRMRGRQIHKWLICHPEIESYVILDDDRDMLANQAKNFVKTHFKTGLDEMATNQAIEILNIRSN